MGPNSSPIFSKVGDVQWQASPILAANTTRDLTAGTSYLLFTADASNGGYLSKLRIQPLGTNVATVMRIWINNGGGLSTAANNNLYTEVTMASTTASEVAALAATEITLGFALPPGYRIYATIGTTVAAGFHADVIAGKY